MTRTFIALELDESLRHLLDSVIDGLAHRLPGVRWVDPAGIHLTLAFLGELSDEQLAAAGRAAAVAAQQSRPFELCLKDLGAFGSPRHPRVIWMGIEESSGNLVRLHSILHRELLQRGFEVDTRPFSPHLTLARVKQPLSPVELQTLQRLLASKASASSSSRQYMRHLSVMKSELSRSGARYTCLQAYALGNHSDSSGEME
ncbi:MAG TPA: RNA 2',3'-cyclic phosphodiesterase [Ktedonobacteraceae bacterium]|jgi:2'-5' RNA ligase|nr:RNA 2',3'-cyclic phosphodiesterase [Ktedonobacteraceae bacterium]